MKLLFIHNKKLSHPYPTLPKGSQKPSMFKEWLNLKYLSCDFALGSVTKIAGYFLYPKKHYF